MRAILSIFILSMVGCAAEPFEEEAATIVEQAQAGLEAPASASTSTFHRRLMGLWRARAFQQTPSGAAAWVDLYWVIGRDQAWHVVTLYADAELRVPLLRWDLVRSYRLEGPSGSILHAYDLEWSDVYSSLTPYVDHPGLFAAIGVDDCGLELGVRTDTTDNCGAPFFPFRDCPLMDFAQLDDDVLTFGDPRATDRCLERPTTFEAWSFTRVPLSPELIEELLGAGR